LKNFFNTDPVRINLLEIKLIL